METDTVEQLLNILREHVGSDVGPDDVLEEMGMESLDFMQFITDVRAEVFSDLSNKDLFLFHTVRQLAQLIESKQQPSSIASSAGQTL
jgi:acyl carrier protein